MRSRSSVWTERTLPWAWKAGCSLLPCSHRCVVYLVGWGVGWDGVVFDSVSCCDALHHTALSSNLFLSLLVVTISFLHCSPLSLPPSLVSHHTPQHDKNTTSLSHTSPTPPLTFFSHSPLPSTPLTPVLPTSPS
jgi:hypothetical protein